MELVAEAEGVTPRTLRNWRRLDPAAPRARPGRPPTGAEQLAKARELVHAELERQGWRTGEEPIWRALGCEIPRARVRRVLRELKAERRARHRQHLEEQRVSVAVRARDVVWALDATHLGRDRRGRAVEGEVLREVASTRTIELSVGPEATAEEVVAQLERARLARGTAPLVLQSDNAATYRSELVRDWGARHGVVQLFNRPHTPQHNGAAEHGMRELKEESLLGKGVLVLDKEAARARLEAARDKLDQHRLRATRGWKTAVEADRGHPPWSTLTTRADFLQEVACRMARTLLDSPQGPARRRAARAAILDALEGLSLITRTRGDRSDGVHNAEGIS